VLFFIGRQFFVFVSCHMLVLGTLLVCR
jgi:hypothetical protein